MARFLFLIFFVFSLLSCKKDIDSSNIQVEDIESSDFDVSEMDINSDEDVELYRKITGDYPDGTYCAEVEYYNPNTGTRNTYNLDVEVGYRYTVSLTSYGGGCYSDISSLKRTIENDIEEEKKDLFEEEEE